MISVKIYNSILDADKNDWNLVNKNDYFLSIDYLYHVEKTMTDGFKYWYICVYMGEQLVLTAALFSMELKIDTLLEKGFLKSFITSIRKSFKRMFTMKALVIGSPPSVGNFGVSIREGYEGMSIFNEFLNTAKKIAKKEGIKLLILKEVPEHIMQKYVPIWESGLYVVSHDLPNNILELKWNTFEEYLYALRKKYRQTIQKSVEKLDLPGITVEEIYDISSQYSEEEHKLYINVLGRSETVFETLTKDFFAGIDNLKDMSPCLLAVKENGIIIGYFLIAEASESGVAAMFAGINYDRKPIYDTYFNLFYEVIKFALKRGKKVIYFGQKTYEVKQRMGCTREELYIILKHKNRFINFILKLCKDLLLPETILDPKNVMK